MPQGEVDSANTMIGPTPTEKEDFGYAFATSSPTSQWEANALHRPQPFIYMDTWMHLLPSALTIFARGLFHQRLEGVGVSGHYFDDELTQVF